MEEFQHHAKNLFNIILSSQQIDQFVKYKHLLQEWNNKINLTRIASDQGIEFKHFLDSMSIIKSFDTNAVPKTCVDIGTGAGFPGLVMKILFPDMDVTLVETIQKKAQFCDLVVHELNLTHVHVVTQRAESMGLNPQYREHFDIAVSRAVAFLPILVEYMMPLVKLGGVAVAMKGEKAVEELSQSGGALSKLGGQVSAQIPVFLPGDHAARSLIVIKKIRSTPDIYPRQTHEIMKLPLK